MTGIGGRLRISHDPGAWPTLLWRAWRHHFGMELDCLLDRRGLLRHGRIGQADCWLVKAEDFWRARRDQLRRHCPACRIRPKYGQNHPR